MNIEAKFIENRLKKLLYEMDSTFSDFQSKEEVNINATGPEFYDNYEQICEHQERFAYLADHVFKMCLVYFEIKNVTYYIDLFKDEIRPFLDNKDGQLFSSTFNEGNAEFYCDCTAKFWSFLQPFEAFNGNDIEILLKRTGISFLENILESTAVVIKELDITPTTETQVYKAVKILTSATFPSASFPSQSFQKTAKCYIPDILIPSLSCAIEYKYADNEIKLIDTIDQILVDVKGYDKHQIYKLFYAVFYVKPGICTKARFDVVWKEKEFPENWKGILVIGI